MTDRITLTGVRGFGYHGVLPAEREHGQEFLVDVVLHLDVREAASTDDLMRTVHYGQLAEGIVGVVEGQPVALLETLASRVADLCLEHSRVDRVEVTVHKPAAPIAVPFADVSVTVDRRP